MCSVSTMAYNKVVCWCFILSMIVFVPIADSHPINKIIERQKRMSDQRLAELETLIALSKMKHKLVTVPVGFGRVDPAKLGRRRRSVEKLLRTLISDTSSSQADDTRETEENRIDNEDNLLLNLLYNEELRERHRISSGPD